MPTYDWKCPNCGHYTSVVRRIAERDDTMWCGRCTLEMIRVLAAPLFKFQGRVTPGGGPDRFTADMLGYRLDELPSGLRTKSTERA